jgi:DNA (cytosine-5)-methyltransferase 1
MTTTTTTPVQIRLKLTLKKTPDTPKYTMVDLFAGTGAFTYAFDSTNRVTTVWANDCETRSEQIYRLNFNTPFVRQDFTTIDPHQIPPCEILTAGFACQPFSIAGLQKGFSDVRSNVFWKILETIQVLKPRVAVLENVKNLQSHDHGLTFKTIIDSLTNLGYHIHHRVLNTSVVTSLPQNRERIYIVCFRDQRDADLFSFDKLVRTDRIWSVLEPSVDSKYYYGPHLKIWDAIHEGVTKENTFYQYRRYYVRENKSGVCPTLTANMGAGGHNVPLIKDSKGIRKLTPRECFNLQGFPSNYQLPSASDCDLYKLAGNAVSIPVVQQLATHLVEILDK